MAYVTQMVKHNALPIKAMMESKPGKRMAMTKKMKSVTILIRTLRKPLVVLERPTRADSSETTCCRSPNSTSRVVMMGWALRGTLVSGMMAMKMTRSMFKTSG